jgi:hypothetical protein
MNDLIELIGDLRDCPWSAWRPGTLRFCEAHRCEWIVAPAETWSNLPYILVGLFLMVQAWTTLDAKKNALRSLTFRFGLYSLIVGICSSLFHASHTFFFETLDLASMFFLGVEMIIQNLFRLGWLKGAGSPSGFAILLFIAGMTTLLGTEGTDRLWIFSGMIAVALWMEALIYVRSKRRKEAIDYGPFIWTLGLFSLSYGFWLVDYHKIVCWPDFHYWSGHATWHVLNSACFLTLARFYARSSSLAPVRGSR